LHSDCIDFLQSHLEGPGQFLLNPYIWRKLGHRHICVRFGAKYERGRWNGRTARTELDRFFGPRGRVDANCVAIFWTGQIGDFRSADVMVEHLSPYSPKAKGGKAIVLEGERIGELVNVLQYKKKFRKVIVQVDDLGAPWEDDETVFCAIVDPVQRHESNLPPPLENGRTRSSIGPPTTFPLPPTETVSWHMLPPTLPTPTLEYARSMDQYPIPGPSYVNHTEECADKDNGVDNVTFVTVDQPEENTVSIPFEDQQHNSGVPDVRLSGHTPAVEKEWWQIWEEEDQLRSYDYGT
jgi:hypothetical protein